MIKTLLLINAILVYSVLVICLGAFTLAKMQERYHAFGIQHFVVACVFATLTVNGVIVITVYFMKHAA